MLLIFLNWTLQLANFPMGNLLFQPLQQIIKKRRKRRWTLNKTDLIQSLRNRKVGCWFEFGFRFRCWCWCWGSVTVLVVGIEFFNNRSGKVLHPKTNGHSSRNNFTAFEYRGQRRIDSHSHSSRCMSNAFRVPVASIHLMCKHHHEHHEHHVKCLSGTKSITTNRTAQPNHWTHLQVFVQHPTASFYIIVHIQFNFFNSFLSKLIIY